MLIILKCFLQQRVSVDSGSEEEQTVTTRIFRRRLILKVPCKPGAEAGVGLGLVWFGLVWIGQSGVNRSDFAWCTDSCPLFVCVSIWVHTVDVYVYAFLSLTSQIIAVLFTLVGCRLT